jgi:uroporphyrinogen-III synthase
LNIMRILVTRPEPDAQRFAAQLKAHDIDAVVAPLMTVELSQAPLPPLDNAQALVFTSANGVRVYAAKNGRGNLPV